jgi:predicted nucleic acid-binding protein
VNLYAESSAVVAWLLNEDSATEVLRHLAAAESVLASDLTLIECDRVLRRAAAVGELTEAEAADRRANMASASAHWHILRIAPEVVERCRQPFPVEPIRTLDSIHLASALMGRGAIAGLKVLSLDDRVRKNAVALGFEVLPPEG